MPQHPEAIVEGKKRPFTGAEFLELLRDGREVYIYGERVKDVTNAPCVAQRGRLGRPALRRDARRQDPGHAHRPDRHRVRRLHPQILQGRPLPRGGDGATRRHRGLGRITYGWMGRSPDYKAALLNTLGANAEFYGKFAGNARAWHKRAQEAVLYLNHALVNPPIDRSKPVEEVKDVYISIQKETDAGIYVSGAKVVATNSALTHYNFLGQNMGQEINDPSMVVMFIAPMDTPGIKLICRASYELAAAATGSPWDYPLTSRYDENDAIFVFDNAFIPWENVLIHRDVAATAQDFYPKSGFVNGFTLQGCTRLAVKLDFIVGCSARPHARPASTVFRGVQAQIGEVIGWRNLFWSLTDAMACNPEPWVDGAVLPNIRASSTYRMFMTEAYPAVRAIVEKVIASGLIYLPSHARDFKNPDIDKYLALRARLERHRLQGAHQDHEAALGCDRHRVRRAARALRDELCRQPRAGAAVPAAAGAGLGRAGGDGSARRAVHGRLRRGWLAAPRLPRRLRRLDSGQAVGRRGPDLAPSLLASVCSRAVG